MKLPEELQFMQNGFLPQKTSKARLDGKVCVISGTTSGVGYEAAKQLAAGGAHLVMICRNEEKALKVKNELENTFNARVDFFIADYKILSEVRRAGEDISKQYPKIHALINNAGVFNKSRHLTPDGNEEVFGVIHLASFLLTSLLIPNLKDGAPSRIIDISSEAHRFGGLNIRDLNWKKRPYVGLWAYGAAKIAQILTMQEMAEQLEGSGVTVNAMHPGAVRTNIGMNNNIFYRFYSQYILRWFLKEAKSSGESIYYLTAAPEIESVTGKFFNQTIEEKPAWYTIRPNLKQKVWDLSETLIHSINEGDKNV
jgi:retinol dehydrogenase 13